jgi:hypothetical protein
MNHRRYEPKKNPTAAIGRVGFLCLGFEIVDLLTKFLHRQWPCHQCR